MVLSADCKLESSRQKRDAADDEEKRNKIVQRKEVILVICIKLSNGYAHPQIG